MNGAAATIPMAVITTGSRSAAAAVSGQQVRLVQLVLNAAQVAKPAPVSVPSSPATGRVEILTLAIQSLIMIRDLVANTNLLMLKNFYLAPEKIFQGKN